MVIELSVHEARLIIGAISDAEYSARILNGKKADSLKASRREIAGRLTVAVEDQLVLNTALAGARVPEGVMHGLRKSTKRVPPDPEESHESAEDEL